MKSFNLGLIAALTLLASGCVVAPLGPPRARVAVIAPAPVVVVHPHYWRHW